MTQIKYIKDFPKIEFEDKEYYKVGCRTCGTGIWELYSDGIEFLYRCPNCLHVDRIRITKLQAEMDKDV